jgi:hypothetical protein
MPTTLTVGGAASEESANEPASSGMSATDDVAVLRRLESPNKKLPPTEDVLANV